jgi:hypothetical protein
VTLVRSATASSENSASSDRSKSPTGHGTSRAVHLNLFDPQRSYDELAVLVSKPSTAPRFTGTGASRAADPSRLRGQA